MLPGAIKLINGKRSGVEEQTGSTGTRRLKLLNRPYR